MSDASASAGRVCEDGPDVAPIIRWLIEGADSEPEPAAMFAALCEQLVEAGLPVWRVGLFVRTLHPEVFGRNFIWRPDKPVELGFVDFDVQESEQFLHSPMRPLFFDGVEVRHRVNDATAQTFPFLEDMRLEGVTDYFAAPLRFTNGTRHVTSWTTRAVGGFTAAQLDALRTVLGPLTRFVETVALQRTAVTLLETYVGNRAGARILGGQIRRGHTESMNAVIWLSDLRGFTALSDRLPPEQIIEILNGYFDCQVPAITQNGGEVLKFMGDGLLAVFPVDDEQALKETARRALAAAQQARDAVAQMPAPEDGQRLRFGLALHVGQVLYGNIGGGNRLDFTCIGPAVNLAARLEKIAGRLGRTIVASADFAHASAGAWQEIGEFPIAGFASAARVFGLPDEDAPSC